jgi:DNA-binding CsgD family transcriptional regulator/tetratricopeptide (TPR) repeat protein
VFVGRQAELDVLAAALHTARAGQPQIVWVEGEPGIGKTAFVRRCLSAADGLAVIEASCDESEITFEYGVVSQLIARAQPRGDQGGLAERIGMGTPASVFSVGADLLGLLGSLQDDAPVMVAIDDAQWLDPSSAGALLFALRRLHADRVLVLIAARPDAIEGLGPSWSKLLSDSGLVKRVPLPGLTGPEVVQLAESLGIGQLTLAAGQRLREHTDGHPLYVKALLSEIPRETLNFAHDSLPAPHSFAATVLAKMATISPDAQNLVAAAAVAGVRAPLRLAASAAGLNDPLAALEEALEAELLALVPGHASQEITFPHPLLRAAVYDDLSPTRRRELHLACARLTSGSVSLGHRVAATPSTDDELAAELERTAETEISGGRLRTAVERLMWATRIAGTQAAREKYLLSAVECLVIAGDLPAAQSHRDDVLACSDSARRSYVIAAIAATEGRLIEAVEASEQVLARPDFAEAADELEGPVTALLSISCAFMARGEEAVQWARRALGHKDCPPTAMVVARQGLLVGLAMLGRGDEAIATLDYLSPSRIDPDPFEAELMVSRGNVKTYWGDLQGALEDLSKAIRWSRAGAQVRSVPNGYAALAETEYRLGRWDDALTHADVAVSLGEDSDRAWDLSFVHAVASYPNASRGNFALAAEHVAAARRAFESAPLPMGLHYATVAEAHLAWAQGEWDVILRLLAPANSWVGWGDVTGLGQRIPRLLYAEALLARGRLDEAAAVLEAIDVATPERELSRIDVWRMRGTLEHAKGHTADARQAFAQGKEAARVAEAPFNEALLDLAHGIFLRKTGSRRAAIAALRSARQAFERLGAVPSLERCNAELAACGVSQRARGGDDRFGLTAREGVVARLVASGKSNREVADELYLSTKAIEYHLGNVFAKLNIRSRHELAARLGTGSNGDPLERAPVTR